MRGVDLNHRPLGYECNKDRNFNDLQGMDGTQKTCKEHWGTTNVPQMFPVAQHPIQANSALFPVDLVTLTLFRGSRNTGEHFEVY